MRHYLLAGLGIFPFVYGSASVYQQTQAWKNVVIGAGGFVTGIVFNPTQKGLTYLRTDIGGLYRANGDSWVPLTDYANDTSWHDWGIESVATDPIEPNIVYAAVGLYTNSWDSRNGNIIKSTDQGRTWKSYPLPFKNAGNMPGRGLGERLAIDPHNNHILFYGAPSGKGLWKSVDAGITWTQVTSFPDPGTYIQDPSDSSGYNSDKIGIGWVTFDSNSGNRTLTPRIFVGVATIGSSNVFQSNDGGTTWQALPDFASNAFIAHKGILSPKEHSLYVSFSNGAGPYDGSAGRVGKFNITSGNWTDVTPAQAISDNSYGFGGLTVDLQRPGTVMVAALNEWWPDANIYRTTDGGNTWSPIWAWNAYPSLYRYFGLDNSQAPYLGGPLDDDDLSLKEVGWMIEALVIDPHDSNHWLYGTGSVVSGGHDLLNWDTVHNVSIKAIAAGLEETAVLGLISPTSGSHLLSVVGDVGGFNHVNFDKPSKGFTGIIYGTMTGVDYAGNNPNLIVRADQVSGSSNPQVATSADGGNTWTWYSAAPSSAADGTFIGGSIVYSANGDTILWSTSGGAGVLIAHNSSTFSSAGLPSGSVIASDKKNNTVLYAASGSTFYLSSNSGSSWAAGAAGNTTTPNWIAASPYKAGELWVSGNAGVFHSKDYGETWSALAHVTNAWRIAVGAPQYPGAQPTVFVAGTINGLNDLYRSDDGGANWIRITDDWHGFGATSSLVLAADPRIYKRVYVGTNGRGIFWNSDAW